MPLGGVDVLVSNVGDGDPAVCQEIAQIALDVALGAS